MRRRSAAILSSIALVLSACGAGTGSTTTGADTTVDPGEAVSITTSDGLELEGRQWGDGADFVVLAHMAPADMSSWADFARLLAAEGYTALAFNFRGYGRSDGESDDFDVAVDVRAAVDAAMATGAERVFVVGASMGGAGAIAASASSEIAGTVALSAPTEFKGVNAESLAQFVTNPLLLVAAEDDGDAAEDAAAIGASAKTEAQLVLLSGAEHGTNLFAEHGSELAELILDFLAAA